MPACETETMAHRTGNYIERAIEDPDGEMQQVRVHIGESPLLWLYARGHLKERLYLAGERLRQDWERAGLGARVTMAWDAAPPSGGRRGTPAVVQSPGHAQITAKDHLHAALDRAGPGLKDILWRVVCAGEGLSAAERALGWPSRAAKLVLTFALERVADYYQVR